MLLLLSGFNFSMISKYYSLLVQYYNTIQYLQRVVVVGVDTEVGEETVNHQVNVLFETLRASEKRFLNLEQEVLEIIDDGVDNTEDDIVTVQNIDVGGSFTKFDTGNGSSLYH